MHRWSPGRSSGFRLSAELFIHSRAPHSKRGVFPGLSLLTLVPFSKSIVVLCVPPSRESSHSKQTVAGLRITWQTGRLEVNQVVPKTAVCGAGDNPHTRV